MHGLGINLNIKLYKLSEEFVNILLHINMTMMKFGHYLFKHRTTFWS